MKNNRLNRHLRGLYLLLLCVAGSSCYSLRGTTIPADCRTFAVGFFENVSTSAPAGYDQQLGQALRDRIRNQTALNDTNNSEADIYFTGKIMSYNISPVGADNSKIGSSNVSVNAQNRLNISILVISVNKKDEKLNYEQLFTQGVNFPSNSDFNSIQNNLIEEINKNFTDNIINRTFNNW